MKNIYFLILIGLLTMVLEISAQFPPHVGLKGSEAIFMDSSIIKSWATNCKVNRGWQNIEEKLLGKVSFGSLESALGIADGSAMSLGDGGSAILEFSIPIQNGDGPDFAIYENSFDDYFLELASVSVSSNGVDFVKFPCVSNTQTLSQKGTFDTLTASKLHNLAGKYRFLYGTPFNLEDLKDSATVNINLITHIKITDVVGSINEEYGNYDINGHLINDPFPTPFPSGGFDLDAVAVINQASMGFNSVAYKVSWDCYPNPVISGDEIFFRYSLPRPIINVAKVFNYIGIEQNVNIDFINNGISLNTNNLISGQYFLSIDNGNGYNRTFIKFLVK